MTKGKAVAVAVLLAGLAYGAVTALTERVCPDTGVPPGRERRAALAIRDNVTPFQKWGSRQFTAPYLERYYDQIGLRVYWGTAREFCGELRRRSREQHPIN